MIWSKLKQQLESFICPGLQGRVEYRATSYRYAPDKAGRCYITVDKKEVFNMGDVNTKIIWYQTEQDIKKDPNVVITVSEEDILAVRRDGGSAIPENRLRTIACNRKISKVAKDILDAQGVLSRSDFYSAASEYLSTSIDKSLESNDILPNIFALIDRRLGKKRILELEDKMNNKHPIVQYFYQLRRSVM